MTNISEEYKDKFLQLINQKMGISIRPKDLKNFSQNINQRIEVNKLYSASEYYELLTENTRRCREEWQKLAIVLTNLESYFFRDKGQIQILQNYILPKLIKKNNSTRNINIVSAGCSTGEEVYSLAILLKEITENVHEWNIKISGLDVNLEALEKAQKGVYGSWSLRSMPQEKKDSYFKYHNDHYEILPEYKKMVRFQHFNLVNDSWDQLNPPPDNVDLIICRNVFIYFDAESIQKVVNKFKNILKISGFLMTGHAEVDSSKITQFEAKSFPESLIYIYDPSLVNQKYSSVSLPKNNQEETKIYNSPNNNILPLSPISIPEIKPLPFNNFASSLEPKQPNIINNAPKTSLQVPQNIEENLLFIETQKLIKEKSYKSSIENTQKLIEQYPKNILPYQMMAEIYANTGDYLEAEKYCNLALKIDSFAVYPHYILSHLADANGDLEESKKLLKKIIYLDANFIPAYVELANIYQIENEVSLSQKMWKNLGEVLNKLPDTKVIPELDNLTVSQLKEELKTRLTI
ncbi:CheR family methyltransferase [Geminocystis sp. CENA526]|uniref:CheR family methyltransferase n=1 Tax=Geminocystis sp. CENA526 TaxID=1355871 RepID=UPI003D6F9DA1